MNIHPAGYCAPCSDPEEERALLQVLQTSYSDWMQKAAALQNDRRALKGFIPLADVSPPPSQSSRRKYTIIQSYIS